MGRSGGWAGRSGGWVGRSGRSGKYVGYVGHGQVGMVWYELNIVNESISKVGIELLGKLKRQKESLLL